MTTPTPTNFNRPLGPFAILYEPRPSGFKIPKKYEKHPALRGREYTAASALCETQAERNAMRKRVIREWEKAQILRVNGYSDLARSTNPDKTNAIVGRRNSSRSQ